MEPVSTCLESCNGIGYTKTPVIVAMPVYADLLAFEHILTDESHKVADAFGGCMAAGIRKTNAIGTLFQGRAIDGL